MSCESALSHDITEAPLRIAFNCASRPCPSRAMRPLRDASSTPVAPLGGATGPASASVWGSNHRLLDVDAAEPLVDEKSDWRRDALMEESKWDALGCTSLKKALLDTTLVDAAWLAGLADEGHILPRCQDVPAEAKVSLAEMEAWDDFRTVAALVIS